MDQETRNRRVAIAKAMIAAAELAGAKDASDVYESAGMIRDTIDRTAMRTVMENFFGDSAPLFRHMIP